MRVGPKNKLNNDVFKDERFFYSLNYALTKLKESEIAPYIAEVYLYGSCARKEQKYTSDIDLFVELGADADKESVHDAVIQLKGSISPAGLYDVPVEMFVTIGPKWKSSKSPYHKNIRRDGIKIWHKGPISISQKTTETF